MRAEGLNLSPLFQIIFRLEFSSEISHYLSFKVSVHHQIHCPPALPALGLTFSFHTVIPTVPDNKTVLPRRWALSETPAPCSQLSLCLTLHGCVSLLTWTGSHTTAHLCQNRQLIQFSQRQIVLLRKGISSSSSSLLRLLPPVS